MHMTLFVKDNKICYTVGNSENANSKLSPLGYVLAGKISGRDMSGNFPTMTDVLKDLKNGKS
jgi:hypothetical protein